MHCIQNTVKITILLYINSIPLCCKVSYVLFYCNTFHPRGRRHVATSSPICVWTFQSTPPAKAETPKPASMGRQPSRFQSTPPAKAETAGVAKAVRGKENFNPLHPRRRRPMNLPPPGIGWRFQSTPPAKAETIAEPSEKLYSLISIHSTHEGGDDYPVLACN